MATAGIVGIVSWLFGLSTRHTNVAPLWSTVPLVSVSELKNPDQPCIGEYGIMRKAILLLSRLGHIDDSCLRYAVLDLLPPLPCGAGFLPRCFFVTCLPLA